MVSLTFQGPFQSQTLLRCQRRGFGQPDLVGGGPTHDLVDLLRSLPSPNPSEMSLPPPPLPIIPPHLVPSQPPAGIPVADIFPVPPPALGEPTTLVCMVSNIFPPAVEIAWQVDGVPVTRDVTHTHYTPTADLAFVRFSYLPVTPNAGDVYACVVTQEANNSSIITYWVPQNPDPDEVLETALCGAAMALGVLLALLGAAMCWAARRSTHGT
uniref:Ig-like domain-containing protein n=1 Tax=Strix occidentalis caurina TaxID=311401 RepID=A0A8D0FNH8_STROC